MNPLNFLGLSLLIVAAGIVLKQRQAKSCLRHSRVAGAMAWGLAAVCAVTGALLLMVDSAALR